MHGSLAKASSNLGVKNWGTIFVQYHTKLAGTNRINLLSGLMCRPARICSLTVPVTASRRSSIGLSCSEGVGAKQVSLLTINTLG
jgi:hypothetical protein